MRQTRLIALTFVLGLWSFAGWAQDYTFRVMASKGMNKANGERIMIGSKVTNGSIEVSEGGYLGLAHKSGKTVELQKAGTYPVSKLAAAVSKKGNTSAASRYMNFVVEELTQKKDADAMARRYRHMSKTGSASRAMDDADKKIRLLIPKEYGREDGADQKKNDTYLGNYAAVSWYLNDELDSFDPSATSGTYEVVVMDMGETPIFTINTSENTALINLNDERLNGKKYFLYKVMDANDKSVVSKEHVVKVMNDRMRKEYAEAFAQLPQEDTAIASLIRAKFFEEKGLLSDAMAAYTQAVMLAPQVQTYKDMRDAFLERAEVTKEADQARTRPAESGE